MRGLVRLRNFWRSLVPSLWQDDLCRSRLPHSPTMSPPSCYTLPYAINSDTFFGYL
jgi:hypothetical protein